MRRVISKVSLDFLKEDGWPGESRPANFVYRCNGRFRLSNNTIRIDNEVAPSGATNYPCRSAFIQVDTSLRKTKSEGIPASRMCDHLTNNKGVLFSAGENELELVFSANLYLENVARLAGCRKCQGAVSSCFDDSVLRCLTNFPLLSEPRRGDKAKKSNDYENFFHGVLFVGVG